MTLRMRFAPRLASAALALLVTCFLVSTTAFAQDKPTGTAGTMSPAEKAMMDAMAKASTPGPNQEMLTSMAGDWTYTVRMWMNPGAAQPTESKGTVTYTSLLGGRFVQGQYHGDMMGQPFEGLGLLGYDNTSGKFEVSWADNAGTSILYMTGNYDADAKTVTYTGQMDDILNPGAKINVRQVVHLTSPDSQTMEWYETRNGKETKTMEIVYNRAK